MGFVTSQTTNFHSATFFNLPSISLLPRFSFNFIIVVSSPDNNNSGFGLRSVCLGFGFFEFGIQTRFLAAVWFCYV
ncbi:hypothetical protein P8452_53751 [Trifolium repens]|nr:hypothetical protein P8452_53751 [Trifolium repens]